MSCAYLYSVFYQASWDAFVIKIYREYDTKCETQQKLGAGDKVIKDESPKYAKAFHFV